MFISLTKNSQVLPRDYCKQADIELVFKEMAEQVAIRLRKAHKKASNVSIYVGFSKTEHKKHIQAQMKIEPSNSTKQLMDYVLTIFLGWGAVRHISVTYSGLVDDSYSLISLFDDAEKLKKKKGSSRRLMASGIDLALQ